MPTDKPPHESTEGDTRKNEDTQPERSSPQSYEELAELGMSAQQVDKSLDTEVVDEFGIFSLSPISEDFEVSQSFPSTRNLPAAGHDNSHSHSGSSSKKFHRRAATYDSSFVQSSAVKHRLYVQPYGRSKSLPVGNLSDQSWTDEELGTWSSRDKDNPPSSEEEYLLKFIAGFLYAFCSCGILPLWTCVHEVRRLLPCCDLPRRQCSREWRRSRAVPFLGVIAGLTGLVAIVLSILAKKGIISRTQTEELTQLNIRTTVDMKACRMFPSTCNSSGGMNYEVASSENRNPIVLASLVTREDDRRPVNDLAFTDWNIGAKMSPEPGFKICSQKDCTDPFNQRHISEGSYNLFLIPMAGGNWEPGFYAGIVNVVTSNNHAAGSSTFEYEIHPVAIEAVEVGSVDTTICKTAGCAGIGHTNQTASTANHNPVLLVARVTKGGEPLPGLGIEKFDVENSDKSLEICGVCNQGSLERDDGEYRIMLDRVAEGNWNADSYTGTCTVRVAQGSSSSFPFSFAIQEPVTPPFLDVQVVEVDTEACAADIPQCSFDDHNSEVASDDNHNPIRLVVEVANGITMDRVSHLDASNFAIEAENKSFDLCNSSVCGNETFRSPIEGVYVLYLDWMLPSNWIAGKYYGTVAVHDVNDDLSGDATVTFEIPTSNGK